MLELQGVVRRAGGGACTVTLLALCLGATAPTSFADERGGHSQDNQNRQYSQDRQQSQHRQYSQDWQQSQYGQYSQDWQQSQYGQRGQHHGHKQKHDAVPATHAQDRTATEREQASAPAKAQHRKAEHRTAQPTAYRAQQRRVAGHAKGITLPAMKLDELLLPGALGDESTPNPFVRRPSAIVVVPAVVPAVTVPETTVPETTVPVVSVVVKKTPKAKARKVQGLTVPAEALLDVTTVTPTATRSVLAPRRLAITLVQNPVGRVAGARAGLVRAGSARATSAVARAAAPAQLVDRTAPRFDAWPTRPISMPSAPADVPLAVALGGLVLALAAARGVSRMRTPQTGDPDLSFPTA